MGEWGTARKKPIEVSFREVHEENGGIESIMTREGVICGFRGNDYIIKGVRGELYPIKKDIFKETYDVIDPIPESEHKWVFKTYCGCYVCELCGQHAHINEETGEVVQYLSSCFCGWRDKK